MIFQIVFWFMLPAFIIVLIFLGIQKMDHPLARKMSQAVDRILENRRRNGRPYIEFIFIGSLALGLLLAMKMIKQPAVWNEGELHVFTDEGTEQIYLDYLNQQFGEVVRTPQSEPVYFLKTHPLQTTEDARSHQFLLFIVPDQEEKDLPRSLVRRLPKQFSKVSLYRFKNLWAQNQRVYVARFHESEPGTNAATILEPLCSQIKKEMDNEILKGMFQHQNARQRKKEMLKQFGWTFETLADFEVRIDNSDYGFVSLSPKTGNRWITVRWFDTGDSTLVSPEWMAEERNRIGREYFHGTRIEDIHLTHRREPFRDDHSALVLQGLWGHEERVIGGPFKSFCYYDKTMKRLYLIDYAVHASGMRKMPFIRRMELVVHSFRTRHSL